MVSLLLVACTRLYKSLCRSVGRSVGPSVRSNENEPNQHEKAVSALEAISNVTAPAQKHATDDAVYTALFNNRDELDQWVMQIFKFHSFL